MNFSININDGKSQIACEAQKLSISFKLVIIIN